MKHFVAAVILIASLVFMYSGVNRGVKHFKEQRRAQRIAAKDAHQTARLQDDEAVAQEERIRLNNIANEGNRQALAEEHKRHQQNFEDKVDRMRADESNRRVREK